MPDTKVSEAKKTTEKRRPNYHYLWKMEYLDILDNYLSYPNNNLKFSIKKGDKTKFNFLSEEDKAFGWNQNFSKNRKLSKFLQCNLHHLPEHLWDNLRPVIHEEITVGYKVSDNNINFFVHKADSDNISKELYKEITLDKCHNNFRIDEELYNKVKSLNDQLIDRGIESWMTIRASALLEGPQGWFERSKQ